jgi:hypothetical protein
MIIGRIGLRKVTTLMSGVGNTLGREINPHVLTPGEYRERTLRKEHFVTTVLASERLFVIGTDYDLAAMAK